ncbi:transglycosylase SLT domain-containing protein [Nitrosomonas ureae]|uniref:Transglycosylase-like protein with SLT domain n=1 Tax=Nitrosomonas ureae TaxID=44577 RepID=A0A2T5ISR2_9PROT|nr:transglycosylase SLT domain-containing protein [Nitrosomonas ureae]PTQ86877.1 transglycosylase-like protein with SLT domain [Nitrosomonas ureae]
MAVKHDNQGFVIGESVDLDKTFGLWNEIREDLRAIRAALTDSSKGDSAVPLVRIKKPEPISSARHQVATPLARNAAKSSPYSPITKPFNDDMGTGKFSLPASPLERKAITRSERKAKTAAANGGGESIKSAAPANRNTTTGRFERKNGGFGTRSDTDDSVDSSLYSNEEGGRALSDATNKIVSAIGDIGGGMEDTDPTIKAFNEVSQPLSRGYEMLSISNGIDDKRKDRWFRRIFGELRLFRKDETLFNKAANKSLRNIEETTESTGTTDSGGTSWLMRYVLPLAIAGIGWLMTGSGKEIRERLSNAHDKTMEAIRRPLDLIGKKLTSFIEGVSSKIESAWSTFTGFVKDKLGIDINKALKPVVDTVKSGYQAVKGKVSSAIDRAYNTAEAGVGSALETVMPKGYRHKATFNGLKGGDKLARFGTYTDAEAQRIRALKTSAANTSANLKGGMPPEIQAKIAAQAKKHGLDPVMMQKIAAMESGGNPNAISETGAIGVFQFTGRTATGIGIKNRFDVDQNIEGGMKLALENMAILKNQGLPITPENLYMMHQIGPAAAKEVIHGAEKGLSKRDLSQNTQSGMKMNYGKNSSTAAEYIDANKTALDKRYASVVGASIPDTSNSLAPPVSFDPAKTVFAPAPSIPSVSSSIPSIPDAPSIITPMGSISSKKHSNNAVMPQEVGQDIKDRRIAHIVTGGLSS